MKTLYLLRHAKSSWEYPELSDLERPLNQRGKKDAPRMGKWLKSQPVSLPELVLCSHSLRTLSTISKLGHAWGLQGDDYKSDSRLYHAHPSALWEIVRTCSDDIHTLMLVGHNPGLSEFTYELCPEQGVRNLPTASVYALNFHCSHWAEAGSKNAEFLFFQYPKQLKKDS